MAMARDYVPRRDMDFNNWFINMIDYTHKLVVDDKVWEHIPDEALQNLERSHDDWFIYYQPTLAPHIPNLTIAKNEARKRNEKIVRDFVQRYLMWPPVTDADRGYLGLNIRDVIPTPQPVPSTVPEIEAITSRIRRVTLRIREFGSTSYSKPDYVSGYDICWGVVDARPTKVEDLPNKVSISANPLDLDFQDTDRGKKIYFAARFYNYKREAGLWSDLESAFIP